MPKKIVVIDDDPVFRALIVDILSAKYTVACADDGAAGLELVGIELPDLVVSDFAMPRMHGFEMCAKIRANPALKHTKILMSSSKSYVQDIANAKASGIDDYLVKPYKPQELLAKVAALIGA